MGPLRCPAGGSWLRHVRLSSRIGVGGCCREDAWKFEGTGARAHASSSPAVIS